LDSATEAFSEKEEADTLEKVSKATSLAGADGDMMARVAPKAFANEAGHLGLPFRGGAREGYVEHVVSAALRHESAT
jgi:hypothetical protein